LDKLTLDAVHITFFFGVLWKDLNEMAIKDFISSICFPRLDFKPISCQTDLVIGSMCKKRDSVSLQGKKISNTYLYFAADERCKETRYVQADIRNTILVEVTIVCRMILDNFYGL